MVKQFGVITYALDVSQQGLMITHNLNILVKDNVDPIVFYREYFPLPITPLFAMMQELEVYGFFHPIIATSFETANRLLHTPGPTKKFFYVMDLEWLYMGTLVYEQLVNVYANEDIELIARSEEHFKLLTDCWKKPIAIIENFNYKDIRSLI